MNEGYFPLNVQKLINVISYKIIVLIMQKRKGLRHAGGAYEMFFDFTPSVMLENALVVRTTDITFIIDVVLRCH